MLKRAIVAFTLGPLTLILIFLGGWFYFLPFSALLIIATIEFARLAGQLGWRTPLWVLIPTVIAQWFLPLTVLNQLFPNGGLQVSLVEPALVISMLAALGYALWLFEKRVNENANGSWFASWCGILFLGWLGSHFFRVRGLGESAAAWTALAMLGTWIADSGAYVFGKTVGKHKLSPRLSPNKTVEGYIGGVIVGTLLTLIIGLLLNLPASVALILGLLVSAVSPIGDLGISMLKRSVGVKDSGNLLPSHGGALDRIDSLIWSVAMAYYLVLLTNGGVGT